MKHSRPIALFTVSLLLLSACATTHHRPSSLALAPDVDLDKMFGAWYIVANIPNRLENSQVGLYDVYSRRKDGDIQEDFYPYEKTFDSKRKHYRVHDWVVPGSHNASWRVQIFWPINVPFYITYVAPDYKYVLFGEQDRSLGWIYSRTQTIDDDTYHSLLQIFKDRGYDITKFRKIVQLPSQIGQSGFGGDVGEKTAK